MIVSIYQNLSKLTANTLLHRDVQQKIHQPVFRAFPGGRAAHLKEQIQGENVQKLQKIQEMRKDWRNILILPTR